MWDRGEYYCAVIFLYSNSLETTHVYSSSKAVSGHCFKGTVHNDLFYVRGWEKHKAKGQEFQGGLKDIAVTFGSKGQLHDNLFYVQYGAGVSRFKRTDSQRFFLRPSIGNQ